MFFKVKHVWAKVWAADIASQVALLKSNVSNLGEWRTVIVKQNDDL